MAKDANTEIAPKKLFPPWSPLTAVLIVVAVYLGASILAEILLSLYASAHHWTSAESTAWLTSSTYAQFFNAAFVYAVMAVCIYAFARKFKVSLRTFGLVEPRFRDIGVMLLGLPVYILGYVILEVVVKSFFPHIDVNQQQQLGFPTTASPGQQVLIFISLVILPPLVEELLMRGFLFTSLLKRLSFIPAAIITSLVFATAHLQLGSGAPPLWIAAIDTFTLSLVLCYMRYKTGSLWPGILLHALKNCVAFLAIFVFHAV